MKKTKRMLASAWSLAASLSLCVQIAPASAQTWVDDSMLSDQNADGPVYDDVRPDASQFKYQKDELAAFCHFGPNTFNEIEWGEHYGSQAPSQIFRLNQDFDADGYVKTLHDAGFKKLIITAKHHDGFCTWNSAWTDYDCAEAGYRSGQGDVLAELSAACTKYNLDMGLYLSPWDIHEESYGYYDAQGNPLCGSNGQPLNGKTWEEVEELDVLDYNEYYNNQLEEILGSSKYGNNGRFVEVWMDGAKGSGSSAQNYDFSRWFETIQKHQGKAAGYDADCMLFGAESYTTVRWIGNENGTADNETWSKSKINRENNTIDSNTVGAHTKGFEDGNHWTVPEVDARITSGWFWGNNKKTPKTVRDLGSMYFNSIGHGAVLLLNIPPNDQGRLDDAIAQRTLEFGRAIQDSFAANLAAVQGTVVSADNVRGLDTDYAPGNLIDGDDLSIWSTDDGTSTGTVRIKLPAARTFDCISIEEAIQYGQRINSWSVRWKDASGQWQDAGSGITIGPKRLIRISPIRSDEVEITVSAPSGKTPVLSEVGLYSLSEEFAAPRVVPAGADLIDIKDSSTFSFEGTWHDETGSQYINGTNTYANPGAFMSVTFTGTLISLLGTLDPNHGTADVYIDDQKIETIDMSAGTRSIGQRVFTSPTLSEGRHTLRLETKTKATGIEAAMVVNNNGKGMVGIEQASYTMNENETMDVRLVRTGGEAPVSVTLSPNPGSAIQDDYNTELIHNVQFAQGKTEKTVTVQTRRNTNKTGPIYFTIELASDDADVIFGWNEKARINIIDSEESQYSKDDPFVFPDAAQTLSLEAEHFFLVNSGENEEWPLQVSEADWASGGKYVNACNSGDAIRLPYTAQAGDYEVTLSYRSGDPSNSIHIFEASGKVSEQTVTAGADDQGAATHTVTFTLHVTEGGAGELILEAGERNAPQMDVFQIRAAVDPSILDDAIAAAQAAKESEAWASYTETSKARLEQALAAARELRENPTSADALNRAKSALEDAIEGLQTSAAYTLTVRCGEHGTADPSGTMEVEGDESVTITFTPEEGYRLDTVTVNGTARTVSGNTLTLSALEADTTVEASFAFDHYTQTAPFAFPTDGNTATLEAEYSILNNTGTNESWPLQISSASWASGGKFVNACDLNDSIDIHYTAAQPGDYTVVLTYRSGDPQNSIDITEAGGKAEAVSVTAGADDQAGATHTKQFTLRILEAGSGVLHIAAGSRKAPQMDKFEITAPTAAAALDDSMLRLVIDAVSSSKKTWQDPQALETSLSTAQQDLSEARTQQDLDTAATSLHQAWLQARLVPDAALLK